MKSQSLKHKGKAPLPVTVIFTITSISISLQLHSCLGVLLRFFSPQESPQNRHSTRRIPSTSPARSDPDGRAEVDRYFAWLIKKYPADDERLVSAKDKVHEKGLDLVTLRKIDNLVLDGWGIVWGLADKIKREIKAFQDYELHL